MNFNSHVEITINVKVSHVRIYDETTLITEYCLQCDICIKEKKWNRFIDLSSILLITFIFHIGI